MYTVTRFVIVLRSNPPAFVALCFLLLTAATSILAPLVSIHDPLDAVPALRNSPPGTGMHLLGTDNAGRDMLARLLWGGRTSLLIGVLPTVIATFVGGLLGLFAGMIRGVTDAVIMRVLDVLFAFPTILLAVAIAGVLSPGLDSQIISITIILVPFIARVARNATVSVMAQPYIEAATAAGARRHHVLLSYALPNIVSSVVVYATSLVGVVIIIGSGLSFLGLGVAPPTPDWGVMVGEGRIVLKQAPHVTLLPGAMIVALSLAFAFVGDALRDAMDPQYVVRESVQ